MPDNQSQKRTYLFAVREVRVDHVASRIANRERYYSPPLQNLDTLPSRDTRSRFFAHKPLICYVDFGTDNVVVVGLKQIRLNQGLRAKEIFFTVDSDGGQGDPFTSRPVHVPLDRVEHTNSVTLTARDGISLRDYAFEAKNCPDTLGLFITLDYLLDGGDDGDGNSNNGDGYGDEEEFKSPSKFENSKFTNDHYKLFEDAFCSDLTIVIGEGDGQKSFKTHRTILAMRSEYFRGLFESGMKDSRQDQLQYEDVDPDAFGHLHKFLYTNDFPQDLPFDEIRNLWEVANRFLAPDLQELLEEVCIRRLSSPNRGNIANIGNMLKCLSFAHEFDALLPHLLEPCLLFLRGSLRLVRTTDEWRELERDRPELVALVLETDSSE